jgi:HTH-type transcriptional regulator / antitoxin HigA
MMKLNNWDEYKAAFRDLDKMIEDGFEGNPEREAAFIVLAKAIEDFEDRMQLMPIRQPQTLPEMIQYKMVERQLKQKDLALLLEISTARLSEILSGKRRITLDVAKKLYERLQISPDFILKVA